MKWSWKIARLAGIDVFMHWTFLLLLVWVGTSYLIRGAGWAEAVEGILFILAIFGCVVLHELGHAVTARRFGVRTRDITLLPIGGVARLERMPEQPLQEFWVAVAGPAVNVVIAAVLYIYLTVATDFTSEALASVTGGSFLENLLAVNVLLVLFNLLPAFPMDGGRVLRALLASRMDYTAATGVAASIGQMMAILFGVSGVLLGNPFLLFIALFVYLGAEGEARMAQVKSLLAGVPVREAMMTRFRTLQPHDTLRVAADELLAGYQQDFPVLEGTRLLGMLRRATLVQAIAESGEQAAVGDFVDRDVTAVDPLDMLEKLSLEMQNGGVTTVPVVSDGVLVGIVSTENVGELMMLKAARQRKELRGTGSAGPTEASGASGASGAAGANEASSGKP